MRTCGTVAAGACSSREGMARHVYLIRMPGGSVFEIARETKNLAPAAGLAHSPAAQLSERRTEMASAPTTPERQAIWPGDIPKPLAPYSPAIKAGGWLFVAGQ